SKSGAAGELVLRESEQEIKLFTEPSSIGNWNDLNVSLKKVNIGDLSPLLLPHNRLEGLLSGTLKVEDPMGKLKVNGNIQGEFVRLDDDSIGAIESDLAYNNETSELTANGRNLDPDHQLSYNLNLFLDNKEREKENRIALKPVNYPFKILERFIGDLFSDLQGYITGNVDMTGPLEELNFSGKAKLHDAGLKVNFTQCYYKIDDTEIELKPNAIELGTFKVRDRFGKTATVTGRMEHTSFRNMFFDIEASIDNQPFELLNTTAQDNDQFYGKAKGTGSLSLIGKESDLYMKIDATASRTDSSSITILSSSSRENGIADYLVERKYGQEMSKMAGSSNTTNITYDVDLNANPLVNITVILDDLTGDEIRGHGEGSLNIRAGTTEPLTMRGRYNIQEGNYLFTFQSFFKKPFEVKGGTDNYIEWTGDPYKAKINLEARYKADKVSFAPLNNSLNLGSDYSNVREDVYVVADLTGELFKPTINFRLEFPPNSQANSDPGLAFNLQQIQKNPNELNKQVTYLIVFNSFAQVTNTFSASTIGEFAANTISGILS
ncbi:MAG: translocation/assembly module TamB domain-containing protein, partial [Bacteroidetes bacterium]|nr:translocation/assembly module TamB domain-containing protein [Bacteroidota bacterium]